MIRYKDGQLQDGYLEKEEPVSWLLRSRGEDCRAGGGESRRGVSVESGWCI